MYVRATYTEKTLQKTPLSLPPHPTPSVKGRCLRGGKESAAESLCLPAAAPTSRRGHMWANVNAQSVHQQNAVSLMQVDMLQLGVLQTQMDNLSVQATLLIGFALSMWGGATLKPLLEDDSQICSAPDPSHT